MGDGKTINAKACQRINMLYHCSCELEKRVNNFQATGGEEMWEINLDDPQSFMSDYSLAPGRGILR